MSECPWSSFDQVPARFCEAALCAWIKEPANTVSNLGYVVIGIVIWISAGRSRRKFLRWLGVVSVLTGLGSAFFHASGIRIAGCADYFGMFLGTGAMTALNVKRWLGWSKSWLYLVILGTTLGLFVLTVLVPGGERWVYALAMPCCFIEAILIKRDRLRTHYKNYVLAWLFVLVGGVFWWLDLSKILCAPENHWLQGHAIWHLSTAVSFYFFFRFYEQFPEIRTGGRG